MARPSRYPKELLDRGVRLALEGERPIAHIAVTGSRDRIAGGATRLSWGSSAVQRAAW